jgi:hypothetical protein
MTTPTPTAVAYFVVRVPASGSTVSSASDAQAVVENYLYSGATVALVEYDVDSELDRPVFEVLVRIETYSPLHHSGGQFEYIVNYQADRLRSGLYAVGAHTVCYPVGAK